jgi:hypothetical protein
MWHAQGMKLRDRLQARDIHLQVPEQPVIKGELVLLARHRVIERSLVWISPFTVRYRIVWFRRG